MISVRNRLQLLSGNRWLLFLAIALLAACSPKLQPVTVHPVKRAEKTVAKTQPITPPKVERPAAPRVSTISLLLPFGLGHLAPGSSYTSVSLREADIAIDYYRGFKLALDSLTGLGYSYKLQVYDTKSDKAQSHSLANNPAVRNSDLIVGPVFPGNMKAFAANFTSFKQHIVSPLSPASPATFKNPQLITLMPPLEYHAWAAARYISGKIQPEKVFVLKSGFSEENEYIIPFRRAIDSLSKKHIKIVYLTVVHGQLNSLLSQLSPTDNNVFMIPATDQHFLTGILRALDTLNNTYPVTVFGHPNWVKYLFLKADLLQRLDTHITSADRIDYKAANTIAFMRQYSDIYDAVPTAYSVKGFDEGLYLGALLGADELKDLSKTDFKGLHNSFRLQKKAGQGWINTHVSVYKYANFELKKVE